MNPISYQKNRPTVCIQGLGFVGMAMAIAVADSKDVNGQPNYNVIGVDLANEQGLEKIESITAGVLPLVTNDLDLKAAFDRVVAEGNLRATTNTDAYGMADIIVVDIHLDVVELEDGRHSASFGGFKKALQTLGSKAKPGTLVLVETTVPPGTCEKVVIPELNCAMKERGLAEDSLLIAHSYERVMPGKNYYNSIVNFWRVYSGVSEAAADAAGAFLSNVINVEKYPLTRLHSTTASETAKVLENSYRAANIALIQEWGSFAEAVGVDLFQVLDAVKIRPTHNNIRFPGFGVGGYCLTKDPHFVDIGARELFGIEDMEFPFCKAAMAANKQMPLTALAKAEKQLGGQLKGKAILLLGVSYLQDVGDTRYSPSQPFVEEAERQGAKVLAHDPIVSHWEELDRVVLQTLPSLEGIDVVVFAVQHDEYLSIDLHKWANGSSVKFLDAHNVLTQTQIYNGAKHNLNIEFIGKGI